MKINPETTRKLAAVSLLSFLVIATALLWFINLIAQQETFAFLLSSDLLAFALLVYVYDRETTADVSGPVLAVGLAFIALLVFLGILWLF